MKKITLLSLMLFAFISFGFGQVFITEMADPNNNADARFVELYNAGAADVDFSTGWQLIRWTNGNAAPQTAKDLTGIIPAGGFYLISPNGTAFQAAYGVAASQDIGTGGPADSNGDDQVALLDNTGAIVDIYGVPGEDGSGTAHEFEDGRAERVATVVAGNAVWDAMEWDVDNDGGAGSGAQDAPAGFDPFDWIGAGPPPAVASPTFTPGAGNYTSAQNVVLETTTAGATIYYTTDGITDPDNTSDEYTMPIPVAATTTIKAIAYDAGMTASSVSTAAYNFPVEVANIETLRAQAIDGTVYKLMGEAIITYQRPSTRNQKYIQDATAGILIDDVAGIITTVYDQYDGITGITGTLYDYNGLLEFIPTADPGLASNTGIAFTPEVVSATDLANNFEDYEAEVIKLEYMKFDDTGDFSGYSNYDISDLGGVTAILRTNFSESNVIGSAIPTSRTHVTCIPTQSNTYYNVTPRDLTDLEVIPPGIPLSNAGILIAGLLIAGILVVRRGRLF